MALISDGKPAPALLTLARRHGIEVSDEVTGQELLAALQEKWLRKTEHQYQIPGGPPSPEDMALLKNLNLVDTVPAPSQPYAGALILGATVIAVRKRLAYLVEQCNRDADASGFSVTFPTVYLLGGARPLDNRLTSPRAWHAGLRGHRRVVADELPAGYDGQFYAHQKNQSCPL